MTLSQSFFVPLYFDEAEADLWLALQQIEPEKRSAFIKATLRQVLLNQNGAEPSNAHFPEAEIEEIADIEEIAESEIFSLDALFAEVNVVDPEAESGGPANHNAAKPASLRVPWDYLLQTVIGVEEDEDVIAAIQQAVHSEGQRGKSGNLTIRINHSEDSVDELDKHQDIVVDQEFDIESLQVDTPVPSSGFEYMMKHIIGIEEDEAVLEIFQARSQKSGVKGQKPDVGDQK